MFKKIGSIMALILGGLLLVYSATRSLDFIKLTLPPERAIMAWFGLASLDGGLVSWLVVYLKGSRGWQRAVAFIMIIVDLVGAVAMFYADTVYNTGKTGLTVTFTQQEMGTFVAALSGVIALNIAATVAFHMVDPDQLREQAEEEAFAKIEDKTLQNVSRNADRLASQLAPTLAADWMAQTEARYMAGIGTSKVGQIIDATAHDIPARSPAPAYMPVLADNPEPEKINPLQWMKAWAMSGKKKYEHATSAPAPTQANRGGGGSPDPAPAPVSASLFEAAREEGRKKAQAEAAIYPRFVDAEDGEMTIKDVISAGRCSIPADAWDKKPSQGTKDLIESRGGAGCYSLSENAQVTWAGSKRTCEKCAFFNQAA